MLIKKSIPLVAAVLFSASTLLLVPNAEAKNDIKAMGELQQTAVNQQVNIMLYDQTGKIEKEFHADGVEVSYKYDKNGKMMESIDNKGKKQKYEQRENYIEVTEYENDKELYKRGFSFVDEKVKKLASLSVDEQKKLEQDKMKSYVSIEPLSTTQYEDYKVNGVLMNDLVPGSCPCSSGGSDPFVNPDSMNENQIQNFFSSRNSILKDAVQIWRKDFNANVYNTNSTIVPSKAIFNAVQTYRVNPKVIITSLQKEASLVSAKPGDVSFSARRFYYAMGYGATDGGDLSGTSGFDVQINKGTELLKNLWFQSPSSYPNLFSNINYGRTVTSNGVTYKNYIWVKNYGTWALFKYTPHALDVSLLPEISGGNYLFDKIFKGYWSTNWN
ncbi:RHS repeat domain-containing protein [Paenibacillus oleatilyticus]|uniref:RHS repeat domain-containing protein n=1 Tax=Paenibacillus oleatilyticus TaxID=2594886 RepID=A0ABV4V485_9BACL